MGVTISRELEKIPYWQEIKDYVNKRMADEGWDDSMFVRLMTSEEENQLRESGNNIFAARGKDGIIELAIGSGKYLDFQEIIMLERKFGTAAGKSILMHLWMAQITCMGKSSGGCDS